MAKYETPAGNELDFLWLIVEALGSGAPGGGTPTPAGPVTLAPASVAMLAGAVAEGVDGRLRATSLDTSAVIPTDNITALVNALVAKQVADLVAAQRAAMPTVGNSFTSDTLTIGNATGTSIAGGSTTIIGWIITNYSQTATVYVGTLAGVSANSYRLLPGMSVSLPASSGIQLLASAASVPVGVLKVVR